MNDVVTTRHLRQSWLTVVVKLYPLDPSQLKSQLADCQKASGEALFDIIVGIINDKEDHPNVHLELTQGNFRKCVREGVKNC